MTTNSTPSTEQVREAYATRMSPAQDTLRRPMFDRWLATIKADAWEEGVLWAAAECGVIEPDCPPEQWLTPGDNPYREQETP